MWETSFFSVRFSADTHESARIDFDSTKSSFRVRLCNILVFITLLLLINVRPGSILQVRKILYTQKQRYTGNIKSVKRRNNIF